MEGEGRVERLDTPRALLKLHHVLLCPPLAEGALGVELPPLIVEAMRHLVGEDGADGAVVAGLPIRRGEERLLQDPCGNEDAVFIVRIERIHLRRRRRPPPSALNRSRKALEGMLDVPLVQHVPVPHKVPCEVNGGVVGEDRGEAHREKHVRQLVRRLGLGIGLHPGDMQDVVLKHIPQPVQHVSGLLHDVLAEVALDEDLAEVVRQRVVHALEALVPPWDGGLLAYHHLLQLCSHLEELLGEIGAEDEGDAELEV
mmetsp:Transcript_9392/g.18772  ORF Transcript_9392/g.18772 Transcript_9392/m.18772 type:complete len:256 (-) Transcript_9392:1209-1976(-)